MVLVQKSLNYNKPIMYRCINSFVYQKNGGCNCNCSVVEQNILFNSWQTSTFDILIPYFDFTKKFCFV